ALTFKSHVDESHNKVMAAIAAVQANVQVLSNAMSTHAEAVDKQVELRMRKAETQIKNHEDRIGSLEKQIHYLMEQLRCVKSEEPVAPAAPAGFNGPPNATILVVRSKELVSAEAVRAAVAPWLADSNLDVEDWEITTSATTPTSKRHIIQITGSAAWAARSVRQALGTLRNRDGSWRKFVVKTPLGQDTDIFISWHLPNLQAQQIDKSRLEHRVLALFQAQREDEGGWSL
ncbi:unnamed protein product, partial [Prorocentrum cordatum]